MFRRHRSLLLLLIYISFGFTYADHNETDLDRIEDSALKPTEQTLPQTTQIFTTESSQSTSQSIIKEVKQITQSPSEPKLQNSVKNDETSSNVVKQLDSTSKFATARLKGATIQLVVHTPTTQSSANYHQTTSQRPYPRPPPDYYHHYLHYHYPHYPYPMHYQTTTTTTEKPSVPPYWYGDGHPSYSFGYGYPGYHHHHPGYYHQHHYSNDTDGGRAVNAGIYTIASRPTKNFEHYELPQKTSVNYAKLALPFFNFLNFNGGKK